MTVTPPDFLTVAEAAAILNVSHQTVRRRIDEKELIAYQIGGKGSNIRIDRRDLYVFLRRARTGR